MQHTLSKIQDSSMTKKVSNSRKKPKKHRKSSKKVQNLIKKLREQPRIGSTAFHKLQTEWYEKLKDDGFRDLEWLSTSPHVGFLPNLKGDQLYNVGRRANEVDLQHYRRWSCYLAHNVIKNRSLSIFAHMYADGKSYRDMLAVAKKRRLRPRNLRYIYEAIKKLKEVIAVWNKKNRNGLDYDPDIG